MNDEQILANLERHKATPHISPQDYFISLRDELGGELIRKHRIYLDTRYWVLLRDAMLGSPQRSSHTAILDQLRGLVRDGAVVCPISDAAYVEVMQQSDARTRLATAELMDELGCQSAITSEKNRIQSEFVDFLRPSGGDGLGIKDKVWVKVGFVLGENVPYASDLDAATNSLFQKSVIDHMWQLSVSEFAKQGHDDKMARTVAASAEVVNGRIVKYASEIRSFKQAFAAEVSGCVKLFDDRVAKMILSAHLQTLPEHKLEEYKTATRNILFAASTLRPDVAAMRMPTLYVYARCHAAIRWDKNRRVDGNWLLDIHHACVAAGYYDAMFTETPLKVLLTSGHVALEKTYGISILSREEEVIEYLKRQRTIEPSKGNPTPATTENPDT
jgi:hypothetical protein